MRFFVSLLLLMSAINSTAAPRPSVDEALKQIEPRLVETRRELHMYPELSNREFETSKRIAARLTALGIPHETGVAKTGIVATIKGGKPGKTVAVRADIDALPITETLDIPYKSKNEGVKHACGHDIHTTVALGTAEILWTMREQLSGTVIVVFQPAEEGPPPGEEGGAPLMIKEGLLDKHRPDAFFALHVWPLIRAGEVAVVPGPQWASSDRFRITVTGKQTHGAAPHMGVDPIVVGAQIVGALQTIASRSTGPLEPVVVTIGTFHAGTRFNIIPATAEMEGTFRAHSPAVRQSTRESVIRIAETTATAHGATAEVWFQDDAANPPLVNDPELTQFAISSFQRSLGASNVLGDVARAMVAEDHAHFAERVPSVYFCLGVSNPEKGITANVHTAAFDADETSISVGVRAMTNLVLDYLEQ
jgi:amidohydrolase